MEPWEKVIVESTNAIFARRMIYKIKEYRAKYKGLDVDSIAEEFATGGAEVQKEWATYTNNMRAIASTCRVQRRIKNGIDWD